MKQVLIKITNNLRYYPIHLFNLVRNKNKSFTIISNDCWGAEVYIDTNLQYFTPFVGLMLMAPCYIKLLQNLELIKTEKLKFTSKSRYSLNISKKYPIGLLRDIEIHFLHYENEDEAMSKWERRVKRIDWNNLFIKFDGSKDFATTELVNEFDKLAFKNKVCFVKEDYVNLSSVVRISEWHPDGKMMFRICQKEFDIIKWLNNYEINSNKLLRFLYSLLIKPL